MTMHIRLLFCGFVLAAVPWAAGAADGFRTDLNVDAAHPLGSANALVAGNNLQWVDRGDEMFRSGGGAVPEMVERVAGMGVPILRYPGGSLADLYHWRDGLGEMSRRGQNEHFYSGSKQRVEVGSQEFLELCEAFGAQPLVTVNVASGSAEEAADWVRQLNVTGLQSRYTGRRLPTVHYWEVGNEPYLKDDKQKALWMTAQAYAAKASAYIEAMRKVDPTIQIAIALRSDKVGGLPATPMPGFNETVLRALSGGFDFVALHDAYLPLANDKDYSDDDLYWASVAAPEVVAADLAETRRMLAALQGGRTVRLAVTEYNALFSYGKSSDAYINSPAGALYVAELLRLFAYTPSVAFANFWSLAGNWNFGAIGKGATPRPGYWVLRAFHLALQGQLLPATVTTAVIDTPRVGYVPAMKAVPKVQALATQDRATLRVLIINHDLTQKSLTYVTLGQSVKWVGGKLSLLAGTSRFDSRDGSERFRVNQLQVGAGAKSLEIDVPPLGIGLAELELDSSR